MLSDVKSGEAASKAWSLLATTYFPPKYKSIFSNLPKKGTQGGLIDLSFTRYFLK